ncbi:MAG: GDP-L-fucose synthase [Chloroflexi bacterium]|nr:GDP-L-fucose synthase [Chloroflexota bacterium]
MEKDAKIFVVGNEVMAGSALLRRLNDNGFTNLVIRTSSELDLTNQKMVGDFFADEKPDYVFLTGAKVGGILANSCYPAEFIYDNIQSQTNVIHSAWKCGVKKLFFLASSCIYPKDCQQPMKEEYLMSGKLEPTSEPYAIAKIAGIRMCQSYNSQYGTSYISVVPADLYGPDDDFDPETSHVLPALIRKIHEAKVNNAAEVVVWGTGTPRRECLYVDDLADACVFLMNNYNESAMVNVGSGGDLSIKQMALLIRDVVGFKGEVVFDDSKPDGTPRKLLDNSKITKLGWSPKISSEKGIRQTYHWYKSQLKPKMSAEVHR